MAFFVSSPSRWAKVDGCWVAGLGTHPEFYVRLLGAEVSLWRV